MMLLVLHGVQYGAARSAGGAIWHFLFSCTLPLDVDSIALLFFLFVSTKIQPLLCYHCRNKFTLIPSCFSPKRGYSSSEMRLTSYRHDEDTALSLSRSLHTSDR